jgi:hypothetical protein
MNWFSYHLQETTITEEQRAPQLHDTSLILQHKGVYSDAFHNHGIQTHSFGTKAMWRLV